MASRRPARAFAPLLTLLALLVSSGDPAGVTSAPGEDRVFFRSDSSFEKRDPDLRTSGASNRKSVGGTLDREFETSHVVAAAQDVRDFLARCTREGLTCARMNTAAALFRVQVRSGENPAELLQHLAPWPGVVAEPDPIVKAAATSGSEIPWWYARKERQGVNAERLWREGTDCSGVVIGVADSGLSSTDLDPFVVERWSAFGPGSEMADGNGHGTHVAGIIAGRRPDAPTGLCRPVSLAIFQVLDSRGRGSVSRLVEAYHRAVQVGVRVLNVSAGSGLATQMEREALDELRVAGVLVIAAAGNEGRDLASDPVYPASYPFENVVAVGATSTEGEWLPGSNYSASMVHLAAPGEEILSQWPMSALHPEGLKSLSGTSLSTPLVTAVAAALWTRTPHLTARMVRARLLRSSRRLFATLNLVQGGRFLDAEAALKDDGQTPADHNPDPWAEALLGIDSQALVEEGIEVPLRALGGVWGESEATFTLEGQELPRTPGEASSTVWLAGAPGIAAISAHSPWGDAQIPIDVLPRRNSGPRCLVIAQHLVKVAVHASSAEECRRLCLPFAAEAPLCEWNGIPVSGKGECP